MSLQLKLSDIYAGKTNNLENLDKMAKHLLVI